MTLSKAKQAERERARVAADRNELLYEKLAEAKDRFDSATTEKEFFRAYKRALYAIRCLEKRCVHCGKPAIPGLTRCVYHNSYDAIFNRKYKLRSSQPKKGT